MAYCSEGEPAEFSTLTIVKRSRKAHRCCDCREPIPVGSSYRLYGMLFDGQFFRERVCHACFELYQFIDKEADAECLYVGQVHEWIFEGLSPHEFLPGGDLEKCPRTPRLSKWLDEWKADLEGVDDAPRP